MQFLCKLSHKLGNIKRDQAKRAKRVLKFHLRKEKVYMNSKWLLKLTGTALAAMLITGCAANNQDVPPPEEEPPMEEPADPEMEDENNMEEDMEQDEENMEEDMEMEEEEDQQ